MPDPGNKQHKPDPVFGLTPEKEKETAERMINEPANLQAALQWMADAEFRLLPRQIDSLANTYFRMKTDLQHLTALVKANVPNSSGVATYEELHEAADRITSTWFAFTVPTQLAQQLVDAFGTEPGTPGEEDDLATQAAQALNELNKGPAGAGGD